jgi:catechol 2,3-dioxygenase-like lactoylglutathione lyase family enzyme
MKAHFILYVADQKRSTEFYAAVLSTEPTLNVPGMTEFSLGTESVLGLMPTAGASRLLGLEVKSSPFPSAEVYLVVDSAADYHTRALSLGARELSPVERRDWGHTAAYSMDRDGHVLAFAEIN